MFSSLEFLLICLSGKFCLLKGLNFLKFTFYKLLHSRQTLGSIGGKERRRELEDAMCRCHLEMATALMSTHPVSQKPT